MKKTIGTLFLLALAAGIGLAQVPADQQKAMEAYQKAGAVTANHQALKYFVGRWDVESTMWTAPGAPPTVSKNTDSGTLIMGGRFVRMDYRGRMMNQPFEGMQISGYDNIENRYKTFWIDNSATSFYLLSGTYDEASTTYTFTGRWPAPLGGMTPVRMIVKIMGPDEFTSETFITTLDGKEFKSMSDRYTRRRGISG
jgi:hypothetical protein